MYLFPNLVITMRHRTRWKRRRWSKRHRSRWKGRRWLWHIKGERWRKRR